MVKMRVDQKLVNKDSRLDDLKRYTYPTKKDKHDQDKLVYDTTNTSSLPEDKGIPGCDG